MVQLLPQSPGISQKYGSQGETPRLRYWECPGKPLDCSPKHKPYLGKYDRSGTNSSGLRARQKRSLLLKETAGMEDQCVTDVNFYIHTIWIFHLSFHLFLAVPEKHLFSR